MFNNPTRPALTTHNFFRWSKFKKSETAYFGPRRDEENKKKDVAKTKNKWTCKKLSRSRKLLKVESEKIDGLLRPAVLRGRRADAKSNR